MSLSFVSSAVLSSSDGVSHNEEKPIESSETQSLRSSGAGGAGRPLFDQLRSNRETDDEKRDEAAKALRGTRALDDEDCAHLDAVERVRLEREARVRNEVEDEVAAFRAARADRQAAGAEKVDEKTSPTTCDEECGRIEDAEEASGDLSGPPAASSSVASITPRIIVKKRRKRQVDRRGKHNEDGSESKRIKEGSGEVVKNSADNNTAESVALSAQGKETQKPETNVGGGGLGGLLGGYGSDSDSD